MRQEKTLLKDEIREKMKKHPAFVIMQYAKLTANTANDFRREMGKMGGDVEVVRKRILIKAAEEIGIKLDIATLDGHIGLVFLGQDPIEATKAVFRFSKERDNFLQVSAGRLDGALYTGAEIEMLSKLPSKDEMRSQLLATLEAPLSQTLAVMEALISSVVYCLDNKSQQGQS